MAKAILLSPIDTTCNDAINEKKIELLSQGKDYTKPRIVLEIIKEWKVLKDKTK